jgi:rhomboid protease GluP
MIAVSMLRQRSGSTVCPGCGSLVGVNDETCYNCGRRNPSLWGFSPLLRRLGQDLGFGPFVIVASVGLYLATLAASDNPFGGGSLFSLFSPDITALFLFGASGAAPVFGYGHWWSVLSAGWLHGSLLHILFNMNAVRQLCPAIAHLYGPGRMMIIYTAGGVAGFTASSMAGYYLANIPFLSGSIITIGASAPLFGLLGALVYYGHRSGSSSMRAVALQNAAIMFAMGLFLPGIDNWAHAGGFGGGWLASRWLDPLTRERIDHLIAGLACIALTALAVVASLIFGFQALRQ